MRLSIVVAMDLRGLIGNKGKLPWQLPADLAHFKKLTGGHIVVMGRRTWESLPPKFRPLPGRTNIVLTSNAGYNAQGAIVFASVEEAVGQAEARGETELFFIGGAEIYRQVLPRVKRIYLTRVLSRFEGDTFFPDIDHRQWREVDRVTRTRDEQNPYDLVFLILERR